MGSRTSIRITLACSLAAVWLIQPLSAEARPRCLGKPATIIGSVLDEEFGGTNGDDVILGLGGNDVIAGFRGNDRICGGTGNELLFPGQGRDRVDGGPGTDAISWNDQGVHRRVVGSLKARRARGGSGLDTWQSIETMAGSPYGDVLKGSGKGDLILGLGGKDRIIGGGGNDLLLGMEQSDRLVGGPGKKDTASFYLDSGGIRASLPKGLATADGRDRLVGIEGLESSNKSSGRADVLLGDAKDNYLYGVGGEDRIFGAKGSDVVAGGNARDYLSGQEGNDFAYGEAGADRLGSAKPRSPLHDPGNDLEIGGLYESGDLTDVIHAGPGGDLLHGGSNGDEMNGGPGLDVVDYSLAFDDVDIRLSDQSLDDGGGSKDEISFVEAIFGSEHADILVGDTEKNYLFGWHGDDQLHGNEGDDELRGEKDSDQIFGDEGDDLLNGGEDEDDSDSDDLDGGIGIDTCKNGETTFMCELPLPVGPSPILREPLAKLGLTDQRLRPLPHIDRLHHLVRTAATSADDL